MNRPSLPSVLGVALMTGLAGCPKKAPIPPTSEQKFHLPEAALVPVLRFEQTCEPSKTQAIGKLTEQVRDNIFAAESNSIVIDDVTIKPWGRNAEINWTYLDEPCVSVYRTKTAQNERGETCAMIWVHDGWVRCERY